MTVKKDDKRGTCYFIVDLHPRSGKRQQVRRRGFKTKNEAVLAQAEVVADSARGTFTRPKKVTLERFLVDEWLPARSGSLRPSTAASYEQIIRNYVTPTIGGVQLADVDGSMLNALYRKLLTEGRTEARRGLGPGLSPKTVRNVHGVLTKAFRDAVRWDRLHRNPADASDPLRGTSPEMKAWNGDELRTFIGSVRDHRWSGIWSMMATTGMRRGEVLGLRWSDIDLDAGTVQSGRRGSGSGRRSSRRLRRLREETGRSPSALPSSPDSDRGGRCRTRIVSRWASVGRTPRISL